MSEITVGKVVYLGPTAIDPRDAEIERLKTEFITKEKHWNKLYDDQRMSDAEFYSKIIKRRDADIAALKAQLAESKKPGMELAIDILMAQSLRSSDGAFFRPDTVIKQAIRDIRAAMAKTEGK